MTSYPAKPWASTTNPRLGKRLSSCWRVERIRGPCLPAAVRCLDVSSNDKYMSVSPCCAALWLLRSLLDHAILGLVLRNALQNELTQRFGILRRRHDTGGHRTFILTFEGLPELEHEFGTVVAHAKRIAIASFRDLAA